MTHPEQPVLDAIAQLEAIENPDEIHDLVRWQLEEGRKRGEDHPMPNWFRHIEDVLQVSHTRWTGDGPLGEALAHLDAPYREHVQLEPGSRVGWQDADGVVHVETVAEHRETPRGSGNWTLTCEGEPTP